MLDKNSNKWTIMVYMAGDNNLSEDMITAIHNLRIGVNAASSDPTASSPKYINFVVQFDGEHPLVFTRRYFDIQDLSKFDELTQAEDLKPIGQKIYDFVEYSANKYPANNYALIISGHSDAFQGRTLLMDENPPGVTTISELKESIKNATEKILEQKLNILGFDSCVMNTFEVMYEFKDLTEVWLGSQGSIPNYTWDYGSIGSELMGQTDPKKLTNSYISEVIIRNTKEYNCRYAFGGRSMDISASSLESSEITPVVHGIKTLIEKIAILFSENDEPDTHKQKMIVRAIQFVHWRTQTFMHHQTIDLKDFCLNLRQEFSQVIEEIKYLTATDKTDATNSSDFIKQLEDVNLVCGKLICNIENMVLHGASVGSEYQFASGISLFFPWSIITFELSRNNYLGNSDKTGLEYPKGEGELWVIFTVVMLLFTARPDMSHLLKQRNLQQSSDQKLSINLEILLGLLGGGGNRDNPHRSRGLDTYSQYFGTFKNLQIDWIPSHGVAPTYHCEDFSMDCYTEEEEK